MFWKRPERGKQVSEKENGEKWKHFPKTTHAHRVCRSLCAVINLVSDESLNFHSRLKKGKNDDEQKSFQKVLVWNEIKRRIEKTPHSNQKLWTERVGKTIFIWSEICENRRKTIIENSKSWKINCFLSIAKEESKWTAVVRGTRFG